MNSILFFVWKSINPAMRFSFFTCLNLALVNNLIRKCSLKILLLKMYNGLKERISNDEKKFFFRNLEEYREGIIPLSSITKIVQSWVVRFEDNYLTRQTLFEPFPKELIKISEFDKQRELKPITPLI